MKPSPAAWPRLSPSLYYNDAHAAIDWLCRAFGFALRLKVPDDAGGVAHSELTYGEAVVMVSQAAEKFGTSGRSPASVGAVTQSLFIYVDNAEAHCAHARAAGAKIVHEPEIADYGAEYWADKNYSALDPEGHVWHFAERVRSAGE